MSVAGLDRTVSSVAGNTLCWFETKPDLVSKKGKVLSKSVKSSGAVRVSSLLCFDEKLRHAQDNANRVGRR